MKKWTPLFLCYLLTFSQSLICRAETASYDSIHRNIVTFTPDIYTGVNYQPCLGVRLSSGVLLTSAECILSIKSHLNIGTAVEALNSARVLIGKIKPLSRLASEKGILGLDFSERSFKASPSYPALHNRPLASMKYAQGFHLPPAAPPQTVQLIITRYKSDRNHHYILNSREPLPPGAPIAYSGKIVCIVAADGACRAPVIDEIALSRVKEDCHDLLPNFYYYSGCVNRTITDCHYNMGSVNGKGTCINSITGESCQFTTDEIYLPESNTYEDGITCPSCSAYYSANTNYFPPPSSTCEPVMCIKGCDQDNSYSNNILNLKPVPVLQKNAEKARESCTQCLAEEQQIYSNCLQICQRGAPYQACKACSQAVQEKEKECQQICGGLGD